jgi:light-regulated signal transduction histidine kinase (bacteriophytochrome)
VVSRSGQVIGGLHFGHGLRDRFTEQHERTAAGIAALTAIAMDNAQMFESGRRTQEALAATNRELRRANDDLNQFAYSASHDLQEPLRHIVIYSQLLERRYFETLDKIGQEYLQHCARSAKRLEALVRDLLSYTSTITVWTGEEAFVESHVVAQKALANLDMAILESGAEILLGPLPAVRIHETHLIQLFQNLVGNAIKYRRVGVPCRITVTADRLDREFRFRVQDNGIGIAPEYHERIFGLFKRLHSSEEYSGTGIGLAICQKIVERYGGRIWVESDTNRGSTFFFTLPIGKE